MKPARPRSDARPVELRNGPELLDHCVNHRAVLPAVETLQVLAREALARDPHLDVRRSREARFLRFVDLPASGEPISAVVEISAKPENSVAATLLTRGSSGSAGVLRAREHAQVVFGPVPAPLTVPLDVAAAPAGVLMPLDPQRLYAELVPFGPAFRNALSPVLLGLDAATAMLRAPPHATEPGPLGSPFPLDAAMHVACAWGQRFLHRVLFPAGYAQRHVLRPIPPGTATRAWIVPRERGTDRATFDVRIHDADGDLHEVVLGLELADLFRGELPVPEWIAADTAAADPLAGLRDTGVTLELLEISALAPFAQRTLTERERTRFADLGPERARSFLAAHVALKRVARRIEPAAAELAPEALETLAPAGEHPQLDAPGTRLAERPVAAAHDLRFAAAAASPDDRLVGIDVEPITARALHGARLFASTDEQRWINGSRDARDAALRAWTTKEAVAKAIDLPLALTWRAAEVRDGGPERSRVEVRGFQAEVRHVRFEDHLFTLVLLPREAGEP